MRAMLGVKHALPCPDGSPQPTIDALAEPVAIMDEQAVIVTANQAWHRLAAQDGLLAGACPGTHCLAMLDHAAAAGHADAAEAADLIRSVLCGHQARAGMRYLCAGPGQWYQLHVARSLQAGPARFAMTQLPVAEPGAAERQLRLYQHMLASVEQAIIVTDLGGAILFWNRFAERQYGWHAGEVLGQDIVKVLPATTSQEQASQIMERLQQGQSWSGEFLVCHRSGRPMPVHVTDWPMRDEQDRLIGVIGISTDMTEQKKTEQALRLSNLVYQAIGEAILVLDMHARVVAINPAFTALTGYAEGEIIGRHADLLRGPGAEHLIGGDVEQVLARTGHWSGTICASSKHGTALRQWLTIDTIYDVHARDKLRICMFSTITDQKRAKETIWLQANYDTLTGLPNRSMFRDRLEHELHKAARAQQQMALMFIDLDQFKEVNDTLGHQVGDELLKQVAQRLAACVRGVDTVARLGGDEFTVILGELSERSTVERVASCIVQAMAQPFHVGSNAIHVTASVGITLYPADARDAATLVRHADQAMYAAKNRGRNRFHYFTERMQQEAQSRMHLTIDLRAALGKHEFELVYQPIVALDSGAVHKAEALLRWRHPVRGAVSPEEFIPVAEQSGIITALGAWAYHSAVSQARQWRALLDPAFRVSINLSPVQLRDHGASGAAQFVREAQLADGGGAGLAILEITEGLLLDANRSVLDDLQALRAAGVQLAIDDFGTGYSALSYLRKFRVDYLKIDRTFVTGLQRQSDDLAMCEAIIAMAHRLGIKVIAEGIERQEQRLLLAQAGCDFGQGFLFARPLPPARMGRMLERARRTPRP